MLQGFDQFPPRVADLFVFIFVFWSRRGASAAPRRMTYENGHGTSECNADVRTTFPFLSKLPKLTLECLRSDLGFLLKEMQIFSKIQNIKAESVQVTTSYFKHTIMYVHIISLYLSKLLLFVLLLLYFTPFFHLTDFNVDFNPPVR